MMIAIWMIMKVSRDNIIVNLEVIIHTLNAINKQRSRLK